MTASLPRVNVSPIDSYPQRKANTPSPSHRDHVHLDDLDVPAFIRKIAN